MTPICGYAASCCDDLFAFVSLRYVTLMVLGAALMCEDSTSAKSQKQLLGRYLTLAYTLPFIYEQSPYV
jgi:hypothetical protein